LCLAESSVLLFEINMDFSSIILKKEAVPLFRWTEVRRSVTAFFNGLSTFVLDNVPQNESTDPSKIHILIKGGFWSAIRGGGYRQNQNLF
jgi:hypothetical protein